MDLNWDWVLGIKQPHSDHRESPPPRPPELLEGNSYILTIHISMMSTPSHDFSATFFTVTCLAMAYHEQGSQNYVCVLLWFMAQKSLYAIDPVVTISAWGTTECSAIEVLQASNCN